MRWIYLSIIVCLVSSCGVGASGPIISRHAVYNRYNWTGGMRYVWATQMDAKVRKYIANKDHLYNHRVIYCHPSDAPQYRILVMRADIKQSVFGREPMWKFLYERGFTQVVYMSPGVTTYVDNYTIKSDGMSMDSEFRKKYGTLLGPGKYVNNTGNSKQHMEQIGTDSVQSATTKPKTASPTPTKRKSPSEDKVITVDKPSPDPYKEMLDAVKKEYQLD